MLKAKLSENTTVNPVGFSVPNNETLQFITTQYCRRALVYLNFAEVIKINANNVLLKKKQEKIPKIKKYITLYYNILIQTFEYFNIWIQITIKKTKMQNMSTHICVHDNVLKLIFLTVSNAILCFLLKYQQFLSH